MKYSQRPITRAVPQGPVPFLMSSLTTWIVGQGVSSASLLRIQNWGEGLVHEIVFCHSDGPRQTGEMGREEFHEVQPKDVQFCTLAVITPCISVITTCAGDVLKKLCRKRPGGPGEQQGKCEPAAFPWALWSAAGRVAQGG